MSNEEHTPHDPATKEGQPATADAVTEEATQDGTKAGSDDASDADAQPSGTPASEAQEATDWQDKYLRLYAEFDNFRKRTLRERGDLIRNASMDVLEKLLPVLDDFDRAAADPSEDVHAVREGRTLIHTKLRQLLEAQGLTKMDVKQGDAFDVDVHEAITNIPAPTPDLAGKVVDVVEPGYMLNDKIMRYAKVVVGQ
jgi:molecular chaperone GrpE